LPITPFHFGVGAAFHAADPRRVSFLSFCVVNCVIDCETVWNFLRGAYPLHRFLHTFLGAAPRVPGGGGAWSRADPVAREVGSLTR